MPHLTVQYTTNITVNEPTLLLNSLNNSLWSSEQFARPEDIKSRLIPLSQFQIGLNDDLQNVQHEHGLIFIHLKLMAGRSEEVKTQLAEGLLNSTKEIISKQQLENLQICIEIEDIAPCYLKTTI